MILEAIREVKRMGLRKDLKALYDAHMKQVRDGHARDEYVYDEGLAAGEAIGEARGEERGRLEGRDEGIRILIKDNQDAGVGEEEIVKKLQKYYSISKEEAIESLKK